MKLNKHWLITLLLISALFLRVVPFNFPPFTSDEARVAARGFVLATYGKDELGRFFPTLFNSLIDYKLPAVSYIAAFGEKLLGKSDFGVRIPFILLGVGLVLLVYKIAQIFSSRKEFHLLAAAIITFSPALIFLSKIPNESILLTFIFTLLFYLLTRDKINLVMVFVTIIFSFLTSKFAWIITPFFIIFTVSFFQNNLSNKTKVTISIACTLLALLTFGLYWQIEQAQRSIAENNFSLFSDITIKNGINRLRGQGLEETSQSFLGKILFNKIHFLTTGILHWLSQIHPDTFFGQFDKSGLNGFISMGALQKVLIIPFGIGLISLVRAGDKKYLLFLIYPILLTWPILFIYPNLNFDLVVTTLPFISLIIGWGLFNMNRLIRNFIIFLMIFEIGFNFFYLDLNIKNTNNLRPGWIKPIVVDGYNLSKEYGVAFSDDITTDIMPFIQWYTSINAEKGFLDIPFPYKFRQTQIGNIKIIGFENSFYKCGLDKPTYIFASKRDLENIVRMGELEIKKTYQDSLGQDVVFLLPSSICVR